MLVGPTSFSHEEVRKRYCFLKQELEKNKINIVTYASDADPRCLLAQRIHSGLDIRSQKSCCRPTGESILCEAA